MSRPAGPTGSSTFAKVVQQMLETHQKKSHDYGSGNDPYGNFRPAEDFGVEPWIGALIRQGDKIARVQSFIQKGELQNESVEDSLLDNAVYATIAYCLFLEQDIDDEENDYA